MKPIDEKSVFNNARRLAAHQERVAYLEQACGHDPEAMHRVLELLRIYDQEKSFLEAPAAPLAGAADALARPTEAVGAVLVGRYKLLEEIGEGGMGSVWMAQQIEPVKRLVAVKLIKSGLGSKAVLARFEAERQALALMDHPNIAKVFDAGATPDGRPFFVMELVKGVAITRYCDEHHLTPRQRLELFVPVCQAVQHAHHKGIIHRDLKPRNVLIALYDDRPVPKVIDFGVAKATGQQLTEQTLHTGFGAVVGTVEYMSPEQASFNQLDVDTRSDIYSLGVLLYELLAGTTPFSREELEKAGVLEMLRQIREQEPHKPSTKLSTSDVLAALAAERGTEPKRLAALVRGELDWIVMKALEKDRSRRYETANAFAVDVQRYLNDEQVHACPPSAWYRFRKFARRNRVVLTTATLVAAALLGGIAVATWQAVRATQAEADALTAAKAEEQAKVAAQAAERGEAAQHALAAEQAIIATREADRSRRLLYASDMALAQQALEAGTTATARAVLERHVPPSGKEDLRGFEWRYLWQLCQDSSRHTWSAHRGGVSALTFSPDSLTLATSGDDQCVRLWDMASRRHIKLLGYRNSGYRSGALAYAPDGKTLAIAAQATRAVHLWDVAERRERATLQQQAAIVALAFTPDGKLLATGCEDGTVHLWNMDTQRELSTLKGHTRPLCYMAFSPNGRTLASAGRDSTVRLWDVAERSAIATLKGHTGEVFSLSFSPDGQKLASAATDSTVRLWDVAGKERPNVLRGQRGVVLAVAFSPDGSTLAAGGGDGTIRLWDPGTKDIVAMLRGHTMGHIRALAYAPDGQTLVSGAEDGTIKVWDVGAKHDPNVLTGDRPWFNSVAFSGDGKMLAVGDHFKQTVRLWDLASRHEAAVLRTDKGPIWCVTFAPDGRTVAAGSGATVQLWNTLTKDRVAEFQHIDRADSIAFSSNGKLLAVGGGSTVKVWDRTTGHELTPHITGGSVQFNPDGSLLAIGSGNAVRLLDVATWREVATFRGHTAKVVCLAFAPNGKTLATGDWQGSLWLWDVVQKQPLASRKMHPVLIASLAFSLDGRRLVTGGGDGMARIWDVARLHEATALSADNGPSGLAAREGLWAAASVATLAAHDGPIDSVAFSPDGNTLATASTDDVVRLWLAPPLPAAPRSPAVARDVPPPVETINARVFSLEMFGTAQATLVAEGASHRVTVTAVDGTDWHARLSQGRGDLQENTTYTIRFRAKGDAPRSISVVGQIDEPDWHEIGLKQEVRLSQEWQKYECKFQTTSLSTTNVIHFWLGSTTGTVWITDFTLTKRMK
jgi:WD40 repeat protein